MNSYLIYLGCKLFLPRDHYQLHARKLPFYNYTLPPASRIQTHRAISPPPNVFFGRISKNLKREHDSQAFLCLRIRQDLSNNLRRSVPWILIMLVLHAPRLTPRGTVPAMAVPVDARYTVCKWSGSERALTCICICLAFIEPLAEARLKTRVKSIMNIDDLFPPQLCSICKWKAVNEWNFRGRLDFRRFGRIRDRDFKFAKINSSNVFS